MRYDTFVQQVSVAQTHASLSSDSDAKFKNCILANRFSFRYLGLKRCPGNQSNTGGRRKSCSQYQSRQTKSASFFVFFCIFVAFCYCNGADDLCQTVRNEISILFRECQIEAAEAIFFPIVGTVSRELSPYLLDHSCCPATHICAFLYLNCTRLSDVVF